MTDARRPEADVATLSAVADLAVALLDSVGRQEFQECLLQALGRHVGFDAGLVLLYRDGKPPRILYNDWRTDKGLSDIQHYLQGPYRLDPFYQLVARNGDDGLYRLSQIAPSFKDTDYYRDYYQHSGLQDEFNFFVSLDGTSKIAISLARRRSREPFSARDETMLEQARPAVRTAVYRHFKEFRPESLNDGGSSLQSALALAVQNFGRSILTDRECQVTQLILFGYSVKGAASKLGISPATVKLHRSNLYSKLDISSQSELFSLFIDAVSSAKTLFEDPLNEYLNARSSLTGATS